MAESTDVYNYKKEFILASGNASSPLLLKKRSHVSQEKMLFTMVGLSLGVADPSKTEERDLSEETIGLSEGKTPFC